MTGIKPSDLKDQLHLVNTAQMPEPDDVVELSCREVDQAFTFFTGLGYREGVAMQLTDIAVRNLWDED